MRTKIKLRQHKVISLGKLAHVKDFSQGTQISHSEQNYFIEFGNVERIPSDLIHVCNVIQSYKD